MWLYRSLLAALLLSAAPCWNQTTGVNVNSRYTVETVELPPNVESRLSGSLRGDLQKLVGEKYNQERVDGIAERIERQLRGYRVIQRLTKGTSPESVKIVFEIIKSKAKADAWLPRLAYNSRQNFSFGADVMFDLDGNVLRAGILTDNDELMERYSGIRGGYTRVVGDNRVKAGVLVESFRAQWNPATLVAQPLEGTEEIPGIYRERLNVYPNIEVEIVAGLRVGFGVSLQRLEFQFPAARHESSHALTTSLRLVRQWEPVGFGKHELDAGYSLHAATNSLDSDFVYTRHAIDARYGFEFGNESVSATFTGGTLGGRAPLYERFLLGNTTTLRGWNKYDIAPLGGDRMAHGSLDYRHHWFRTVYDVGTVYAKGGDAKVRHSLALGVTTESRRETFSLLVAFPLRHGSIDPIFLLGMNF